MSQSLKCPSCAAPLEIENEFAAFIECEFCGVSSQIGGFGAPQGFEMNFGGAGLLEQARKLKEIKQLTLDGKMIYAIKLYRETFGTGLAQAKEAVENIAAGKPLVFTNVQTFTAQNAFGGIGETVEQALKVAQIQNELQHGNKINAVKIYRETFGVGLAEAKSAVEAMQRGESVNLPNAPVKSTFGSNIDAKAVRKTAFAIGSSFLGVMLLGFLVIGLVTFGLIWFITSQIEKSGGNVRAPFSGGSAEKTNEALKFAREVLRFGGEGIGAGFFKDNRSVAVDSASGKIFSVEYSGGKVQVFDREGKFLTQWIADPKMALRAMATDRKGNLYLMQSNGIQVFEAETGKLLRKTERFYGKGMTLAPDGRIIATTSDGFIILDGNLQKVQEFRDAAQRANAIFGFEQIAVDGNGTIYALDDQNGDVCKFAADGKFLNRFRTGSSSPNSVAVDGKGRIFVSDTSVIYVFDADGRQLESFPEKQAFGMAFNDQNELFVASRPFVVKYELQN